MKELEYYKSNYEKELKSIFDYWFELVRIVQIKDNKNLIENEKNKYQKKYYEMIKVDKIAKFKLDTLKYGGKETGRIFAFQNKLLQEKYNDQPPTTALFLWCAILSVLKKEILGQEISPLDIIQLFVNDYDDHENEIREAIEYIKNIYFQTYDEIPFWLVYNKD